MGFLLLEDPKFSQINCLTNTFLQQFLYIMCYNFQRQAVQKGPFFDFRISPYSFFNALASFQLTLTDNNKSY